MGFSDDARAILLLTAALKGRSRNEPKPLTLAEWSKLRLFLDENAGRPQDLLKDVTVLLDWKMKDGGRPMRHREKRPLIEIIEKLLKRDEDVHKNIIEPWEGACTSYEGIDFWIITYTDDEYPEQLKERLPDKYPPLFFGVGDRSILRNSGLAVVGSRHASDAGLEYAEDFGQTAASERITIISGGARGVDDEAMRGALRRGGEVVGILSGSPLERLARDERRKFNYREYLTGNKLVYMSVVGPQGHLDGYGFFRAAMERNAYIYCLSDAALVVHSSNRGGTWSGATENLKKGWVPLWVRSSHKECSGNTNKRKATSRHKIPPQHSRIRTAVLLLTVSLKGDNLDQVRPMNFREWGQFARWLWGNGLTPANLIDGSLHDILRGWGHQEVTAARISVLLDRDRWRRLAENEKVWDSAGIRALTKMDDMYPRVLVDKLGDDSPAVLFVRGDHELFFRDKIAVVGPPLVGEEGERKKYAERLRTSIAKKTASVLVTIGGVDMAAVDEVLSNNGSCIVVLVGDLLNNSIKAREELVESEKGASQEGRGGSKKNPRLRDDYIKNGKLAFLSASAPRVVSTGQAFEQHSDIAYCLSDAGVVMHSDGQGEILQHAMKCLQNNWTPLWVKGFGEEIAGVDEMVKKGGRQLSEKNGEVDIICQLQNIVWRSTVIQRITEKGGKCLPQSEDVNDHIYHILDAVASMQEQVDQGPLFNQLATA